MKKIIKRSRSSLPVQAKPALADVINKIQEQLVSLEQKVDSLINRDSVRPKEPSFNNDRFPKPRHPFGSFRRQDKGRPEDRPRDRNFTQAVCAECGQKCEVPFKPSEDRPVYCRECFAKRKGDRPFGDKNERSFRGKEREPYGEFHHKKKRFSSRSK